MMYDIVGIDMPCVDFNLNVPTMPTANGTVHFHRLSFQGGNKVSTGMCAAARLGANCAILGAVGDEQFGRFCVEDFKRHGIDTMIKLRKEGNTALSFVISDDETKGRSIVYHPGDCARLSLDELPEDVLKNTKYYFLAWTDEVVLHAIDVAKAAGAKIFVDADKPKPEIMDNLDKYDIFVASEFVYDSMFSDDNYEKNLRSVLDMGPEVVIFTFGAKGCCGVSRGGEYFWVDAYKVDVEDTVGAGDVFHGAFLAGLVRGMDYESAARFASAVSAIKCTRIGGRAGIPDYDTTVKFMQTGEIDYTDIDKRVSLYEKGFA